MYELAIRAKNYKCFKDETGFECIRRVNLIIGRNNAGKSTLLDLIEIVVAEKYDMARSTWRNNQQPQVIFEAKIPEDVVNNVFPPNTSGGTIPNRNHNAYGQAYIGKTLKWIKSSGAPNTASFVECDDEEEIYPTLINSGYSDVLSNRMPIPLEGKVFRRLLAERDILPEKAQSKNITIGTNGNGLTNAIQNFINKSDLPSALVESSILNALNTIFAHDAVFTDIVCQMHDNEIWEIYLEEEFKGRIALSQSGSGLKTVMSVLACLILVPLTPVEKAGHFLMG